MLYIIALMFLSCLCFYFVNLIEKKEEEEKWKNWDTERITKN